MSHTGETRHKGSTTYYYFIFIKLFIQFCEFSCGHYNGSSTWSDNHRVHTAEYYHCALLLCEPEDYPVVQLDNHSDYKNTLYLHVQTEYVYEDYSYLQYDNHTVDMDT